MTNLKFQLRAVGQNSKSTHSQFGQNTVGPFGFETGARQIAHFSKSGDFETGRILSLNNLFAIELNTIIFLLPFPNPFIPSELSGSRKNDSNSMCAFYLRRFCPSFVVIGYLFAICRTAEIIQSPTRCSQETRHANSGPTVMQPHI